MAASKRKGLDYFPFDVDFFCDEKIRNLNGEYGAKATAVVVALLCRLYRLYGYYLPWNEKEAQALAQEACGTLKPQYICEVAAGCLKCGLFNQAVFEVFGVLTSVSIQTRYLNACSKRSEIEMVKEYYLLAHLPQKGFPSVALVQVRQKHENLSINNKKQKKVPLKESKRKVFSPPSPQNKNDEILQAWRKAVGRPATPDDKRRFGELLDKGMEPALLLELIQQTGEAQKPSWSYLKAMLRRLEAAGANTIAQWRAMEGQRPVAAKQNAMEGQAPADDYIFQRMYTVPVLKGIEE